jgi:hypothetical protein
VTASHVATRCGCSWRSRLHDSRGSSSRGKTLRRSASARGWKKPLAAGHRWVVHPPPAAAAACKGMGSSRAAVHCFKHWKHYAGQGFSSCRSCRCVQLMWAGGCFSWAFLLQQVLHVSTRQQERLSSLGCMGGMSRGNEVRAQMSPFTFLFPSSARGAIWLGAGVHSGAQPRHCAALPPLPSCCIPTTEVENPSELHCARLEGGR